MDGEENNTSKSLGKLALITGSAKRIGAAIAVHFARSGYDLIIHYNNSESEAKQVVKTIEEMGREVIMIKADLEKELDAFIVQVSNSTLVKKRGGIDVLINSASKYEKMQFNETTSELWDSMHAINSKVPYFLTQGLLINLKNVNGCVINMVDTSYHQPWKYYSNYCASKASLYNQTMSLSQELAPDVRVNGIAPGAIIFPEWIDEEEKQTILGQIPMKREGTVEEIAQTALFLANGPTYITGQIIGVDGGLN